MQRRPNSERVYRGRPRLQLVRVPVHLKRDLSEMLQELRVLLPGTQVLVAFLITLPFTTVFARLTTVQRVAYLATFVSALSSLILLVTPAAYHRLVRPLPNRIWFKDWVSRLMVIALLPLGISISLSGYLIGAVVLSDWLGVGLALLLAAGMFSLWYMVPVRHRERERRKVD